MKEKCNCNNQQAGSWSLRLTDENDHVDFETIKVLRLATESC